MANISISFTQDSLLFFLSESRKRQSIDPRARIVISETDGVLNAQYFDPIPEDVIEEVSKKEEVPVPNMFAMMLINSMPNI